MARLPTVRREARAAQPAPQPPVVTLDEALIAAAGYAKASRSAATWRDYEADWRAFLAWCRAVNLLAMPATPHTVALFLAAEAKLGRAPSTLGRRLAAIRLMHVGARHPSPHDAIEVDEILRGIRRTWKRPKAQKAPAVDQEIQRMVDAVEPQTVSRQGWCHFRSHLWITQICSDVGGCHGYAHFLEALSDPDHDEHEQYMVWICGVFDPRGFDLNRINANLGRR